ncbi:major facilitator superfamily multi-drug efflux pump [Moraxella macacae 0408225]|uniref:Bcr/CflA family efflux transporter n=1 Tax=Moraxella macacae 0408225 TaxID=1230338 RepID=L2F7Q4_9GAMM|nr:multidrug effflux MFS transporter [Moraxella macacae]ELA08945.1 major facilitator superfamily multi-drug efflux pump [Moraxella macacae 0408225]
MSNPTSKSANPIPTNNDYPVFWIMLLGLVIAVGPLTIDTYLPALPSMAEDFGVSTAFIANSVPAYFVGLVVGQLLYGPLSDRIGRITPLYIGMTVYILASVLCATTDNAYVLFIARTVQALGACVGSVVARAMIRDKLHPTEMAKAFSLMTLVMGIAPILAPSLGALLLKIANWRMIFWFLAGFGVLNIVLTKLFLYETLSEDRRNHFSVAQLFVQYGELLKDPRFNYPAIGAGLLMGSMFVYISASPELIMEGYGVSETHFGWIFGMNAGGFIALTQINQFLVNRFKLVQLLRFGALIQVISAGCLLTLGLVFGINAWLPLVLASIFFCIAGLGLTQPNAGAIALTFQKHRAGMASALQGSLNFVVGIFGGLMLNFFPINAVAKLGLTMFILMGLGCYLVWQIDKNLDVVNVD